MIKQSQRLKYDKDFDRVFKMGRSFYGPFLGFKSVTNNIGTNRFGVLVSTKISKKAVIRNKIKRRIKRVISQELPKMKKGNDVVVLALPAIIDKEFSDIESFMKKGFKKLRLYN